jgi:hypothetical protein
MEKRCCICKKTQGLAPTRPSWSISSEFVNAANEPARNNEHTGEMLMSAYIRPNAQGPNAHICDDCLRISLRALKVAISKVLTEFDAGHDLEAELSEVTARLAHLQDEHHNVCFAHDRMQDRLSHVLDVLDGKCAVDDQVKSARWEVSRGHLMDNT